MLILVADDERTSRTLLTAALRKWGHEVEVASDGVAAWELLERRSPRIAVLDWMMPGLDGIELCRRIRRDPLHAQTYVMLVTARSSREDVIAGLSAGADDYLTKPFDPDELHARLAVATRILEANSDSERLLASLSSVLIGLDPDGRVTRWNSVAQETFDLGPAVVMGRPLSACGVRWKNPEDLEALLHDRSRTLQHEDLAFLDALGHERLINLTIATVTTGVEGSAGRVVLGSEVTERRVLEAQLRQSQKLEGIGQLAAGIAHEINTPMQYVGDNLRYLGDSVASLDALFARLLDVRARQAAGTLSPDDQAAALDGLARHVDDADLEFLRKDLPTAIAQSLEGVTHVSRIVKAMKEFSHPGTGEKAVVDLNHAIETTLVVARSELKYVADVRLDLDPALPTVRGIPGELNQVFLNLFINAAHAIADAVKATPGARGSITISTARAAESTVEIRIVDTGCGIPEHIQSRVFEPFFTTKDVGQGTGQGLAMAHVTIVNRHQGRIWFETAPGRGTAFIIRLPAERDSGEKAA
jgi:signal transduction histidine kinase